MHHSFDIEEAVKHGLEKAIILTNIRFWLTKNKANNKNAKEGFYWTYNSSTAFAELFPYMKPRSIRKWLNDLEDEGVLKSGAFNKSAYDRTKWYTIPSEFHVTVNASASDANGAECNANQSESDANGCAFSCQPIPDISTDVNKDINTDRDSDPSFLDRGKTARAMKQSICFESKEQMLQEISKDEYSEYLIQASAKWRGMNEKGKDAFLDEFAGKNATIKEYGGLKETYQTGIKTHMMNSLKYYEAPKEQTTSTYAYYYKIGNKEKKHNDRAMWERDKRNFGNGQGYKEISVLV